MFAGQDKEYLKEYNLCTRWKEAQPGPITMKAFLSIFSSKLHQRKAEIIVKNSQIIHQICKDSNLIGLKLCIQIEYLV